MYIHVYKYKRLHMYVCKHIFILKKVIKRKMKTLYQGYRIHSRKTNLCKMVISRKFLLYLCFCFQV